MSKKIIIPKPGQMIHSGNVLVMPSLDQIIAEALNTVSGEVTKLSLKSRMSSLDNNEHRILQGYVKNLIEVNKELREQDKNKDLEDLTDTELLDMILDLVPKDGVDALIDKLKTKKEPTK